MIKFNHGGRTVSAMLVALSLAACQTMGGNSHTSYPAPSRVQHGVVKSVESVPQENQGIAGTSVGLGAVAGAVIGGVVGHQVGAGRGKTVATIAGAAGGAYVGNELEKRNQNPVYRVTVRLDDGSYQAVNVDNAAEFRVGDRVRLDNGALQRY